jgi:hypothetical protein
LIRAINIKWQRLLDDQGQTCPRCRATGEVVQEAVRSLSLSLFPLRIGVRLQEEILDTTEFAADPSQSNRIWIEDRPIEDWLGAQTGQSACCDACGDAECRTMEIDGQTYEAIPSEMIIRAGLMAASGLMGERVQQSCCCTPTTNESLASNPSKCC